MPTDLAAYRAARTADEHDPHISGEARCIQCAHEWVAVAPTGTAWLECPSCGTRKGAFRYACNVPEGGSLWQCNCGCELFYITAHNGPTCHNCGIPATGWFD